ncbi:MAG: beta-glucosidase, partial [Chloroflexi bacterium]|nr:beta-glucosidase [Chloroflexota bacterium]
MAEYQFPIEFVWGSATASYQIEGAANVDGRGESVWDRFSHTPGKVTNGDTGDVACDHYHRYAEDVGFMRELKLDAYRFSIAWPRIIPDGDGAINQAGLGFYDRVVDALLEAGITPFVTLYHWDLPQALQERQQGWLSRDIVEQFVHYADVVSRHLGDRVSYWTTFNEPRVFVDVGYAVGRHAPGLEDRPGAVQAAHHVLLAHGATVPVLRQNVGPDAQVGIVYSMIPVQVEAETSASLAMQQQTDAYINRWFVDPVLLGQYPQELLDADEFPAFDIQDGDLDIIQAPIDFVGINYYSRMFIRMDEDNQPMPPHGFQNTCSDLELTAMGWEVFPQGLHLILKQFHDRYPEMPVYITENGAAFDDTVDPDGHIHDARRVAYLREHFRMAWQAIQDGVPLRGYF